MAPKRSGVAHLYLSDLDFTLLRSDQTVGALTQKVWNDCVARGLRLSIATARSHTGVSKLLRGLTLREPMILLDGVMIALADGEILHLSAIDKALGDEILAAVYDVSGVYPLLVGLDGADKERFAYPKEKTPCQQRLIQTFHNDRRLLDHEPFGAFRRNLKIVYVDTKERTAEWEALLKERFGSLIEIKRNPDPYIDCWFMTVLHKEGDKAHALARLEAMAGVSRADTTVFGDSHNDLGLFRMAGRKIAVANAIEELKAVADLVLPWSNDEEGVARFLQQEVCDA